MWFLCLLLMVWGMKHSSLERKTCLIVVKLTSMHYFKKLFFFAVLGNFMELIQGGGLCLCEEGAYETSCLGFTCQVRKEVCVCVCVCTLHAHFTLSLSRSSGTIHSDSVK